jgi:hypothetical protein
MRPRLVFTILLVLWMALAAVGCRPIAGVGPTAQPEPTEDFGPTPGPLTFAPDTLPPARAGEAYTAEVRITGNVTPAGDIYISSGMLPSGLEFEFVDGDDAANIRGIPEAAGSSSFTVSVWCFGTQVSGQTGDKEYTLRVEN